MLTFAVGLVAHLGTLYTCLTATDPDLSFDFVFVPKLDHGKLDLTMSIHRMFQWDYVGIFATSILCAWFSVYDIQRLTGASGNFVFACFAILLGAFVLGPGAALSVVGLWREQQLAGTCSGLQRARIDEGRPSDSPSRRKERQD